MAMQGAPPQARSSAAGLRVWRVDERRSARQGAKRYSAAGQFAKQAVREQHEGMSLRSPGTGRVALLLVRSMGDLPRELFKGQGTGWKPDGTTKQ